MSVALDHTIVAARDREAAAAFLAEVLGLAAPRPYGPFLVVELDNGAKLDFIGDDGPIERQHYAFRVDERSFDEIHGRLRARGLDWWADPRQKRRGETYRHEGGRGLYFEDPNGHLLEIITRPYGSGG